ncbi:hypothetical protein ACTMS0_02050 [Micromonospora sp. H33]
MALRIPHHPARLRAGSPTLPPASRGRARPGTTVTVRGRTATSEHPS